MKTVESEWFGRNVIVNERNAAVVNKAFLTKYGDYRVVEGELHMEGGFVYLRTEEGDVQVGRVARQVELVLPPVEKMTVADRAIAERKNAEAARDSSRKRAERYLKVLVEIANNHRYGGVVAQDMRMAARRVVDEECE
jgi:hypothetical protein